MQRSSLVRADVANASGPNHWLLRWLPSIAASFCAAGCHGDPAPAPAGPAPAPVELTRHALSAAPKIGDFVLEAQNSIRIRTGGVTLLGGDLGARGTGTGPFLSGGVAIDLSTGVQAPADRNVIAESVRLGTGVTVGDLQTNRLIDGTGTHHGTVSPLVPLPGLPAAASVSPGTTSLTVGTGGTLTASPGQYGAVSVGTGAKLRLAGGTYHVSSLSLGTGARLEILGPVVLRIQGRLGATTGAFLGAAPGVTATARDLRIEVSGINGSTGALGATPPAATVGTGANITALVLVPNGSFVAGTGMHATGSLMARDLDLAGSGTVITFQDGFDCVGAADGTLCDDLDRCTQTDSCLGGACAGANPVTCPTNDQCHVGICDPATGTCSSPAKPDGAACDDGTLCTQTDTCQAGVCTGTDPVQCPASDQCHDPGECDAATGLCSDPAAGDGRFCDDANHCTSGDACAGGACIPDTHVVCTASNQCHDVGTCNPATGVCSDPPLLDGTACNDGTPCTQPDTCQNGQCVGALVPCPPPDQCHDAGFCDLFTGACAYPAKPDGSACDDADLCTRTDTCAAGTCRGGDLLSCLASDQCHEVGTCDPTTGACTDPPRPNGVECDDGSGCTQTDICQGGVCIGTNPIVCTAQGQCRAPGTCDPISGACIAPPSPDGTPCDDGNECTQTDTCVAGECRGGNLATCTIADQCRDAGRCDPLTGACSAPPKPDGTGCDDGSLCTKRDTCQAGSCIGADPTSCPDSDQCHEVSICDGATGLCSATPKPDGSACDDGDLCTQTSSCLAGACVGDHPIECPVDPACDSQGTCDPTTGLCSQPGGSHACGDQLVSGCEQCDDGNAIDGDGCSARCQFETCPNGYSSRTIQALTFFWLGRSCNTSPPADIVFAINGTEVARAALAESCECEPGPGSVTVSDPTLLALVRNNTASDYSVQTAGELSWAGAIFQTASYGEVSKIWDVSDNYAPDYRPANLCAHGSRTGVLASRQIGASGGGVCAICGNGNNAELGEQCDDGNQTDGDGCASTCVAETCPNGRTLRPVESLTLSWLGHSCGHSPPAELVVRLPAGELARVPLPNSCECGGRVQSLKITDPALLGLFRPGGNPVSVTSTGEVAWVRATGLFAYSIFDAMLWSATGNYAQSSASPAADLCSTETKSGAFNIAWLGLPQPTCGTCGNGNIDPDERCDGYNRTDGDGCSSACQYEICPNGLSSRAFQSLSFSYLARSCGLPEPADIVFDLNGVEVARAPLPQSCECSPGVQTLRVTDPSLLALAKTDSWHNVTVRTAGDISWATLTRWSPFDSLTRPLLGNPGPTSMCDAGMQAGASTFLYGGLGGAGRCGTCGNSNPEHGEECDDGNLVDGDGCSATCSSETCANGTSSREIQALSFIWSGRSCGVSPPGEIVFTLNGVDVAREPLTDTCDCIPGIRTVEVTNPALLALGKAGFNHLAAHATGEVGWISASMQTVSTGPWKEKLWDVSGDYDPWHQPLDLCGTGTQLGVLADRGTWLGTSGQCGTCGDGSIALGEDCDDGNALSGDGCSATCTYETCTDGSSSRVLKGLTFNWLGRSCAAADPSPEIAFMMNGLEVARAPLANTCDCMPGIGSISVTDPRLLSLGKLGGNEFTFQATGEVSWATVAYQMASGSGARKIWDAAGNADPFSTPIDICASANTGELRSSYSTWVGLPEPAWCKACGNGLVEDGEICDDGNTAPGDGCSPTCRPGSCGDGLVDPHLTQLSFSFLGRSCNDGPKDIWFIWNGVEVARAPLPESCECEPGIVTVDVTDPALLAVVREGLDNTFEIETEGEIAWISYRVVGNGGGYDVPIAAVGGWPYTHAQNRTPDLCVAGTTQGFTLQSGAELGYAEQCDDGNMNDNDSCTNWCTINRCTPESCPPPSSCQLSGGCNPATGLCEYVAKLDGTICDDASACTLTDRCQGGACVGSSPVVCPPPSQCQGPPACDPATGVCAYPSRPDGTPCSDGTACTRHDTCEQGACVGKEPVVCVAIGQCHDIGDCNPSNGTCSNPTKPNGAPCDDGNACSQTDGCSNGTCVGTDPVTCAALDQCHTVGTCDRSTGTCSNPAKLDGSACSDGTACTRGDTCQGGLCSGAPVLCAAASACREAGVCNPASGACVTADRPNGTGCDDGNACTRTDTCTAGTCVGRDPITCSAFDQCHTAGSCDPTTGTCTHPQKGDETACDDGNACTQTDRCANGVCIGRNPVLCPAPDQCHEQPACAPGTGKCSNPAKPNGAPCDDGNATTDGDQCVAAKCVPGTPSDCVHPVDVVTGEDVSCELWSDGRLWCWGYLVQYYVGVGDGTQHPRSLPTQIPGAWTSIDAGASPFADNGTALCGTRTDGTLWCWGASTTASSRSTAPTQIGHDSDWAKVNVSTWSFCGIKTDGTLWCWGSNSQGQLGDGSTTRRTEPTMIGGDASWSSVTLGLNHTCGVQTDGTLWCWGANTSGQLGNGSGTSHFLQPTRVGDYADWVTVDARWDTTCGIRAGQTLWCWGSNAHQELGNGTYEDSRTPLQVEGNNWVSVRLGCVNPCAQKANGELWCWGSQNGSAQLGDGTATGKGRPTRVLGDDWAVFDIALNHACAAKLDGSSWCWGSNYGGRMGTGWTVLGGSAEPQQIGRPGCKETCRDGNQDWTEQCDDGNAVAGDGCGLDCKAEYCGDGVVQDTIGLRALDLEFLPSRVLSIQLQINGVTVGFPSTNLLSTQNCIGAIHRFSITDPKYLSLLHDGFNTISVASNEPVQWLKARTFGSTVQETVLMEARAGDAKANRTDACVPGGSRPYTVHHYPLYVEAGEECDDGNNASRDGCSSTCGIGSCGNGVRESGEECDDRNTYSNDGCSATCRREYCGDLVWQPGEACDDGNNLDGDRCSATCQLERCATVTCSGCSVCEPSTGTCTARQPDGTTCSDGNPCTIGESCTAGVCGGGTPKVCPEDACHYAGTCDPAGGDCSNPKPDGTPCDDGSACTHSDACRRGTCVASWVNFADGDPCTVDLCDPVVGPLHVPTEMQGCANNHLPDLVPDQLDASRIAIDPITLALTGEISVEVKNTGTGPTLGDSLLLVFLDRNLNRVPDGQDEVLGRHTLSALAPGQTMPLTLPLRGQAIFPGNIVTVLVDAHAQVLESDEENNAIDNTPACRLLPPQGFLGELRWSWKGDDVMMAPVVGDLDGDGVPEVVFASFDGPTSHLCTMYADPWGTLRILDGRTGQEKCQASRAVGCWSGMALADLDADGTPEILASGDGFTAFRPDCSRKLKSDRAGHTGGYGSTISVADLDHDGRPEVVIGAAVFNSDGKLRWEGTAGFAYTSSSGLSISAVADLDMDRVPEIVAGNTAYRSDGQIYWQRPELKDGFVAVGNFDDDPFGEVVEVSGEGIAGAYPIDVALISHDGEVQWKVRLPVTGSNGAPTVADVDGDGYPEIGISTSFDYVVLRRDGSLLWRMPISEGSSGITSAVAFDFDADGSAELVHGDEHYLRIYRGLDGTVLWQTPIFNATWAEQPIVADVDGDGHAEIVKTSWLANGSEAGIYVYGSPTRDWANARRVWNQHSYHITNVNDDLTIPAYETPSWQRDNSYRLNRVLEGCATGRADLVASYVHVYPEPVGQRVTARVGNGGQTPVLAGASVAFYAGDPKAGGTLLTTVVTKATLSPGAYEDIVAVLPAGDQPIWVSADDTGDLQGSVAELDELNNLARQPDNMPPMVSAGSDLTVPSPASAVVLTGSVFDDGLPYGGSLDVRWTQLSGPGQTTFMDPHAPTTTAAFPSPGDYVLRLEATDGALSMHASVLVVVLPPVGNEPPVVAITGPGTVDLPPATATFTGAVKDDGLPPGSTVEVAWLKVSGPGEVAFTSPNQATTQVTFAQLGTYVLELDATDGNLTGSGQVTVTVVPHNEAPLVSAGSDQVLAFPDRTTTLVGVVTDDGNPAGGSLITSWDLLTGPGSASFAAAGSPSTAVTFSYPGTYVLRLTANDGALTTTSDVTITVAPPAGGTPLVALTAPMDGARLNAPFDVSGRVSGGDWRLDLRLGGEDSDAPWSIIAAGTGEVPWSNLGHLDTTMMLNGSYAIRLASTTTSGMAETVVHVSVEKNLKVGNFTVSFADLSVPVAGLPIEVIRTYDSRDKSVGDFGVGWNVSLRNVRVETSGVLGKGWRQQRQPGFWPTYCVAQSNRRFVTATFPTGKVYRFKSVLSPDCEMFTQVGMTAMSFEPEPGTHGTLTSTGGDSLIVADGALLGADLKPYNPTTFELTGKDGTVYSLEKRKGMRWMRDRNGNTVNVTSAGVIHSSGKGITFDRDDQGRIFRMTDPAGENLTYEYEGSDLVAVVDREGHRTTFTYAGDHRLEDIVDPRGHRALRNEYDEDDGRLARSVDADGKVITYTHDLAANQEVITDRTGAPRVLTYDNAGNVLFEQDAEGGTVTRTFDAEDNRTSETDALGHRTTYTYDTAGNMTGVQDPLGKWTRYTHNAWGQVLTTTDPLGHVTTNTYDDHGNLLSVKDPTGFSTTFTYDRTSHQQTSRTTRNGHTTGYAHDAFGNLIAERDPLGNVTTYTYDDNGNRKTETRTRRRADGAQEILLTRFSYDKNGRLLWTTLPDHSVTSTTYNATGLRETSTDARDRTTRYTYDAQGRLCDTEYPDHTHAFSTYDEEGRRLTSTDRAGRTTTMEYDRVGRLKKTIFVDHTFTSTDYYLNGWVKSSTDAGNHTTRYEYDEAGRQTKVTDANNQPTTFTYDDAGNQLTVTDALNHTTTSFYDANNRLWKTLFHDGTFRTTTYDREGQRIAETDQENRTTKFTYDPLGRLATVTDALAQVTRYGYDEVGNRTSVTDAADKTTKLAFDTVGREIRRELPDASFERKTYYPDGALWTRTDFQNRTTTFAYDLAGRLASKTYPDDSTVGFTYTPSGRRWTAVDARGTTTYTYDDRDRLKVLEYPDGKRLEYDYDLEGNRKTLTAKVGATTLTTGYGHDTLDRIASVTDPDLRVFGMQYDDVGSLAKLVRPNGVDTVFSHDSLNRLTSIRTFRRETDVTIASYGYTLGATGIRKRVDEGDGTARVYEYDDLYRLTKETVTGAQSYENSFTYDAVSNRKTQTTTRRSDDSVDAAVGEVDAGMSGARTINYGYDSRDRLTREDGTVYSWSENGNLVGKTGEATYEWDFDDRLVKVVKADGSLVENTYDVDGVLVRTSVTPAGGSPQVTDLLVDTSGGLSHVVAEVDGSGTVTALYVRAGDMLLEEIHGGVAKMYEADGLGSTRSLLDGSGAQTDTWSYEAFGTTLSSTGTSASPYRFAGERFVGDVGMYQNRARWLDTRAGRFVSYDHGQPTGYVYSHGDPVNYADPSGYLEWNAMNITLTVAAVAVLSGTMYAVGQGIAHVLGNYKYNTSIVSGLTPVKHEQLLASFKPYAVVYSDPDFDRGVAKGIRWFWEHEPINNLYWAGFSAKAYRNAGYEMSQDLRLCAVERYLDGLAQSQPGWHTERYPGWQVLGYDAAKWAGLEKFLGAQGFYPPSPYSSNARDWYEQGRSGISGQFGGVVPWLRCWRWTDVEDKNPFNFATGAPVANPSVPEQGCEAPP